MRQLFGAGIVVAAVIAAMAASVQAQQAAQARQAASTSAKAPADKALQPVTGWIKTSSYVPPKTPWGDPDIQGGYTNVNENGIPFEKPGNFANRQIEEIDDSELAELQREYLEELRRADVGHRVGQSSPGTGRAARRSW